MPQPRILAFAGSLRAGSFNRRLVEIAAAGARDAGAEVTLADLREYPLPVFDEDLEARDGLHANARRFKDLLLANRGLLVACPEYNSSVTAAFKNVIDWASRPCAGPDGTPEKPLGCFDGKIAALMSASPGALGGLRGLVHARAILGNIRVLVIPDQVAVPRAHEAFNADGLLRDPAQQAAVLALGARVAELVRRLHA